MPSRVKLDGSGYDSSSAEPAIQKLAMTGRKIVGAGFIPQASELASAAPVDPNPFCFNKAGDPPPQQLRLNRAAKSTVVNLRFLFF